MNPKRSFLTISISCLLTLFAFQAMADNRTAKPPPPVAKPKATTETTRSQPKDLSRKTPQKSTPLGYCCKDGETSKSTAKTCKKERGAFYRSEREAAKSCQGYCCADFAVSKSTKEKCKSVRGKYYSDKQQADRFCESQKGFCCIEGQTSQLTKRECNKKRGEFYSSKKRAVKECRPEAGFCNQKGRTFRLTQEQCDKKKGNYFTSQILAKKAVVKLRQQELTEKKSDKKLSPVNKKAVGVASPLALQKKPPNIPPPPGPDLDREPRDSGHPDLVLTLYIELPEQDGSWGSPKATINVTNIGNQATSAETTVDLFISDHPNLHYGRTIMPFWSKMVPILVPNMTHSISYTFNISETWTLPGTQTSHTILPGSFRLVSHLNTELLAPGEEEGSGANNDEVIFEYSGYTGFYDLAMLGAKLTSDNRLKLSLRNLGADISQQKYSLMDVVVSIDGGAFKRVKLTAVDPQERLRAGPLDSPSALPKYIFTWPLPTEAGGDGLAPFAVGARHQITARVGMHAYNNNVHFSRDSRPGNNEKVHYVGGGN